MFTITKLLIKVIFTVLVFNWTLTEIDLLMPGTKDYAQSKLEQIQIPNHQEIMAALADEDGEFCFAELGTKIDAFLVEFFENNQTASIREYREANLPEEVNQNIDDLKQLIANELELEDSTESWEAL